MANIIGQLESLKTLRIKLSDRNVSMFSSVKEIQDFRRDFPRIKSELLLQAAADLNQEIRGKQVTLKVEEKVLSDKSRDLRIQLENKEERLKSSIDDLKKGRSNKSWLLGIFITMQLGLKVVTLKRISNHERIITRKTRKTRNNINRLRTEIDYLVNNEKDVIDSRVKEELEEVNRTYNVVNELRTTIAGAIGEGKVERQLKKLSDSFYIINDFKYRFNKPITHRQTGEKIFSFQIDHLVIGPTGIFILETKNWSQRSVESLNLRSPIDQIHRASYALFILLNNRISLNTHHWGEKKISVKNVLVMTQATTQEKFKFVSIRSLNDLNSYLTYFDPIYSEEEVSILSQALLRIGE